MNGSRSRLRAPSSTSGSIAAELGVCACESSLLYFKCVSECEQKSRVASRLVLLLIRLVLCL